MTTSKDRLSRLEREAADLKRSRRYGVRIIGAPPLPGDNEPGDGQFGVLLTPGMAKDERRWCRMALKQQRLLDQACSDQNWSEYFRQLKTLETA